MSGGRSGQGLELMGNRRRSELTLLKSENTYYPVKCYVSPPDDDDGVTSPRLVTSTSPLTTPVPVATPEPVTPSPTGTTGEPDYTCEDGGDLRHECKRTTCTITCGDGTTKEIECDGGIHNSVRNKFYCNKKDSTEIERSSPFQNVPSSGNEMEMGEMGGMGNEMETGEMGGMDGGPPAEIENTPTVAEWMKAFENINKVAGSGNRAMPIEDNLAEAAESTGPPLCRDRYSTSTKYGMGCWRAWPDKVLCFHQRLDVETNPMIICTKWECLKNRGCRSGYEKDESYEPAACCGGDVLTSGRRCCHTPHDFASVPVCAVE